MHVRLAEQDAGVVDQVPRPEVVRSVDDQLVLREQLDRVVPLQPQAMFVHRHVRVQRLQGLLGGLRLRHSHPIGRVEDLALEVGLVDHVVVHDPDPPHARRRQIQRGRRSEPAGADQQHLRLEQLRLPRLADLRDQEMPAVARPLRVGETDRRLEREAGVLPRRVASRQAADLRVAHVLQRLRREERARPARAVEDDVGAAVRHGLLDPQLQEAPWDVPGTWQHARVGLVLLAHVQKHRFRRLPRELCRLDLWDLRPGVLEQFGFRFHIRHLGLLTRRVVAQLSNLRVLHIVISREGGCTKGHRVPSCGARAR